MSKSNGSVSPREAAQLLGVNLAHIYQLCWTGKLLGCFKVEGKWLIPKQTLQDWKRDHSRAVRS